MLNYLIRVQLPDRPGALGAVASRIGSVGADVVSIDILQRSGGIVVDELGVVLAGDHLIKLLRDEILEVDGVSIESMRPVDGALPDRYAELLDVATELFLQTSSGRLADHLVVRVRQSLDAAFAVVLDCASHRVIASDGTLPDRDELSAVARRAVAPESASAGSGGVAAASGSGGAPVTVSAAMVHADLVLVVGRSDPALRAREMQWVSTMAQLADHGWRELA